MIDKICAAVLSESTKMWKSLQSKDKYLWNQFLKGEEGLIQGSNLTKKTNEQWLFNLKKYLKYAKISWILERNWECQPASDIQLWCKMQWPNYYWVGVLDKKYRFQTLLPQSQMLFIYKIYK